MKILFEEITKVFLAEGWSEKEAKDFSKKLGRNEAVIAILKMLFLKRLESSIEAFRISIERLLDFQRKFLQVFEQGRMLDRDTYRKFFLQSVVRMNRQRRKRTFSPSLRSCHR